MATADDYFKTQATAVPSDYAVRMLKASGANSERLLAISPTYQALLNSWKTTTSGAAKTIALQAARSYATQLVLNWLENHPTTPILVAWIRLIDRPWMARHVYIPPFDKFMDYGVHEMEVRYNAMHPKTVQSQPQLERLRLFEWAWHNHALIHFYPPNTW